MSIPSGDTIRKYRPDIDGLRAVAVLSVVLFHVNNSWLPGGYVGVDIFFVISGFLIGGIVMNEATAGTFSFAEFYRRRIKRIAPAYFTVLFVTLAAGALLMQPVDFRDLSRSAIWSVFSASNIFFWLHVNTGYFATASDQLPLLHTWSLGVEEQFYIVVPPLLLLLCKTRRRRLLTVALIVLCALSFGFAQWALPLHSSMSYYSLPTRAGELLIGVLAALVPAMKKGNAGAGVSNVMALIGACLIAYSLVHFTSKTPFPGYNAVVPCLGTALVLFGCRDNKTLVGSILSLRPMVWIGMLSYSMYLWHWPILAFVRYFNKDISDQAGIICIGATIALAWVTYELIEHPLRMRTYSAKMITAAYYVAPAVVFCVFGMSAIKTNGFEQFSHQSQRLADLAAQTAPAHSFPHSCELSVPDTNVFKNPRCITGAAGKQPGVIIWGDSNAAHFVGFMGAIGEAEGFAVRNASLPGCPALFDSQSHYGLDPTNAANCAQFSWLASRVLPQQFKHVVMASRWATYLLVPRFEQDLRNTLKIFKDNGVQVIMLGQVPNFPKFDSACMSRNVRFNVLDCEEKGRADAQTYEDVNFRMRTIVRDFDNVTFVDVNDLICQTGQCSPYQDGRPLYTDTWHLSESGARLLGQEFVKSRNADQLRIFRSLGAS